MRGEREGERCWADFLFYSALNTTKITLFSSSSFFLFPKAEKKHETHKNP